MDALTHLILEGTPIATPVDKIKALINRLESDGRITFNAVHEDLSEILSLVESGAPSDIVELPVDPIPHNVASHPAAPPDDDDDDAPPAPPAASLATAAVPEVADEPVTPPEATVEDTASAETAPADSAETPAADAAPAQE